MNMEKIEKRLAERGLALNRLRTGMQVTGTEWDRRNALVEVIYEYRPTEDLLSYLYHTQKDPTSKLLFDVLFSGEIVALTQRLLGSVAALVPEKDDIEYLNAFLYTAISLRRLQSGNAAAVPEAFQTAAGENDPLLFQNLKTALANLPAAVPDEEALYIFLHLPGNPCRKSVERQFETFGNPLETVSRELLYEVQKREALNIPDDPKQIRNLAVQLNASICRTFLGIPLHNPLLAEIRSHYNSLYAAVQYTCNLVFTEYHIHLSEHEIAFITMYLGYLRDCGEWASNDCSVLILCPNGIGAARILFGKMQKLFPDLRRIEISSLKNWRESNQEYDLILSTVDLQNATPARTRVLIVSPFLSADDIERIRDAAADIQTKLGAKNRPAPYPPSLGSIHRTITQTAAQMFQSIRVHRTEAENMNGLIAQIASRLEAEGVTTNRNEVERLITEREAIGSVVIPDARLALLHTRSETIREPYIGVYRLNGALTLHNPDARDEPVDTFVVLLARKNEHPEILEMLGNFSIAMAEESAFAETLRTGTAEEVRQRSNAIYQVTGETTG